MRGPPFSFQRSRPRWIVYDTTVDNKITGDSPVRCKRQNRERGIVVRGHYINIYGVCKTRDKRGSVIGLINGSQQLIGYLLSVNASPTHIHTRTRARARSSVLARPSAQLRPRSVYPYDPSFTPTPPRSTGYFYPGIRTHTRTLDARLILLLSTTTTTTTTTIIINNVRPVAGFFVFSAPRHSCRILPPRDDPAAVVPVSPAPARSDSSADRRPSPVLTLSPAVSLYDNRAKDKKKKNNNEIPVLVLPSRTGNIPSARHRITAMDTGDLYAGGGYVPKDAYK